MVLADLGAEVIKIDRASSLGKGNELDFQSRSKYSITADLKKPDAIDEIKKLLSQILLNLLLWVLIKWHVLDLKFLLRAKSPIQ